MDYESLLRKYMAHLRTVEGCDFTDNFDRVESRDEVDFSDEEWDALVAASEAGAP